MAKIQEVGAQALNATGISAKDTPVNSRTLVARVMAGLKVFLAGIFTLPIQYLLIPNGDWRGYFTGRAKCFGVDVNIFNLNAPNLTDLVKHAARALAERIPSTYSLKPEEKLAIAAEYVLASLLVPDKTEIVNFANYVGGAVALKQNLALIRAAEHALTEQAFKGSYGEVERYFTEAVSARAAIRTILAMPTNGLLRIFFSPISSLSLNKKGWDDLKKLNPEMRTAAIFVLKSLAPICGWNTIGYEEVKMVTNAVKANTEIIGGTPTGVNGREAAEVYSLAFRGQALNGDGNFTTTGLDPHALAILSQLTGSAEVTVSVADDHNIKIGVAVKDTLVPNVPKFPMSIAAFGQQTGQLGQTANA